MGADGGLCSRGLLPGEQALWLAEPRPCKRTWLLRGARVAILQRRTNGWSSRASLPAPPRCKRGALLNELEPLQKSGMTGRYRACIKRVWNPLPCLSSHRHFRASRQLTFPALTLEAETLGSTPAGSSACKAKLPAGVLGFVVLLAWPAVDAADRPRRVPFLGSLFRGAIKTTDEQRTITPSVCLRLSLWGRAEALPATGFQGGRSGGDSPASA